MRDEYKGLTLAVQSAQLKHDRLVLWTALVKEMPPVSPQHKQYPSRDTKHVDGQGRHRKAHSLAVQTLETLNAEIGREEALAIGKASDLFAPKHRKCPCRKPRVK